MKFSFLLTVVERPDSPFGFGVRVEVESAEDCSTTKVWENPINGAIDERSGRAYWSVAAWSAFTNTPHPEELTDDMLWAPMGGEAWQWVPSESVPPLL